MNGAQALIRTLVDAELDVCFTNPGTSEMHFVAALDDVAEMRGILCLFEGVATAAADGYGRIAGRPAATLLHLGPGLGNGFANLHNARRARTPLVNIVGDHAIPHKALDAPLESDIDAVAGACSGWVHRSESVDSVAADALAAIDAATSSPGRVATLILPADVCWTEGAAPVVAHDAPAAISVDDIVAGLADELSATPEGEALLFVGGRVMTERGLTAASRVAAASGARLFSETFPARHERGAGRPAVERLAYLAEFAEMQLAGATKLLCVDTPAPVSFFAYPDKASVLTPEDCDVVIVDDGVDPVAVLEGLAERLDAPAEVPLAPASRPELPTGDLDAESLAGVIGALLVEDCIVVDESNTSGLFIPAATAGCPPHDWLCLTGGSIGIGLPLAVGAAVAAPDRKVLCLESDGSAMYTLQALWTMVREELDVVSVILSNRSYAVLNMELNRVGADAAGPKAKDMLDLTHPELDFVPLAEGMGVPATRATTVEEFATQLEAAFAASGPRLIDARIPALGL